MGVGALCLNLEKSIMVGEGNLGTERGMTSGREPQVQIELVRPALRTTAFYTFLTSPQG